MNIFVVTALTSEHAPDRQTVYGAFMNHQEAFEALDAVEEEIINDLGIDTTWHRLDLREVSAFFWMVDVVEVGSEKAGERVVREGIFSITGIELEPLLFDGPDEDDDDVFTPMDDAEKQKRAKQIARYTKDQLQAESFLCDSFIQSALHELDRNVALHELVMAEWDRRGGPSAPPEAHPQRPTEPPATPTGNRRSKRKRFMH